MMGLISNDSDKPLPKGLPSPDSATSLPSTSSSFPIYDEVFNSSDKAELLEKAQCLVQLLVTVDECNASWRSMFADVLIVKGNREGLSILLPSNQQFVSFNYEYDYLG